MVGDKIDVVWLRWLQSLPAVSGVTQAQVDAAIAAALTGIPEATSAVIRGRDGITVEGVLPDGPITIGYSGSSINYAAVMARISLRC